MPAGNPYLAFRNVTGQLLPRRKPAPRQREPRDFGRARLLPGMSSSAGLSWCRCNQDEMGGCGCSDPCFRGPRLRNELASTVLPPAQARKARVPLVVVITYPASTLCGGNSRGELPRSKSRLASQLCDPEAVSLPGQADWSRTRATASEFPRPG